MIEPSVFVRNEWERCYAKLEIDRAYWHPTPDKWPHVRFSRVKSGQTIWSSILQRQWVQATIEDPKNQLLILSSTGDDSNAMTMAAYIAAKINYRRHFVLTTDISYRIPHIPKGESLPTFLLFHNILGNATNARCEQLRNNLVRFRNCARVVVVAGCKNPHRFATEKLGLSADCYCRIAETTP